MKPADLKNKQLMYSEANAALYLGISKKTLQLLPIPRYELIRDDNPNNVGYMRKRRFVRYEKAELDKFKEENVRTPTGWRMSSPQSQ